MKIDIDFFKLKIKIIMLVLKKLQLFIFCEFVYFILLNMTFNYYLFVSIHILISFPRTPSINFFIKTMDFKELFNEGFCGGDM